MCRLVGWMGAHSKRATEGLDAESRKPCKQGGPWTAVVCKVQEATWQHRATNARVGTQGGLNGPVRETQVEGKRRRLARYVAAPQREGVHLSTEKWSADVGAPVGQVPPDRHFSPDPGAQESFGPEGHHRLTVLRLRTGSRQGRVACICSCGPVEEEVKPLASIIVRCIDEAFPRPRSPI